MGHDDIYLLNGRILKMKYVDNYLKRIGNKNDLLKKWIILGACCLLSGAVFLLVGDSLKLKKLSRTQTNQETKIKSPNNSVKNILYSNTVPNRAR